MRPVVLHVVEALEAGVARHVVDLVRHTTDVHHEVALPSRRVGWDTDRRAAGHLRDAGAKLHLVEMRRSPLRPENVGALATLVRLIRSRKPDVVHGHSSIGGALGRVASWPTPARRVYTPNGVNPSRAIVAVERRLGRITDRLVAVSESEASLIRELRIVDPARVVVIENGISSTLPAPAPDLRSQLGVPAGAPLVATVGRLVPQKAPEVFVRACAYVAERRPDAHFAVVGSGPLRPLVVDEIARHAHLEGRIHLLGAVPDAAALMPQFDVFVLTSRFEGCPYSALEAMRAGVPVVLTDVAGNRDVIESGVSGLLAVDAASVGAAVGRLIEDGNLRLRTAEHAKQRVRDRFDVEQMGRSLRDLYVALALR